VVRVKICGITNFEDAHLAAAMGADLLGFIFYPPSPRYVSPQASRRIVAQLVARAADFPQGLPVLVGVFVDETPQKMGDVLNRVGLHLAQLAGDEPVETMLALKGRAFKALRPRSPAEMARQAPRYSRGRVAADVSERALQNGARGPDLLVDAYHPQLYGGTGQTGDWRLAARLARQHRLLLAGGLKPDNVTAAIDQVRPWGVDVSSGVETAPGRKDHRALRQFIAAAKGLETGD
jgi:phosphoribosylanthranilate isomerase